MLKPHPHFFQLEVALGAVGEVHSPVLHVLLVLGAVVKRHSVVIYRIFVLSVLVVPGIPDPNTKPSMGGDVRERDDA